MNGKEKINMILNRKPTDRVGFWHGNLVESEQTREIYYKYFKVNNELELSIKLGDDLFWVPVDWYSWKHPQNKPMFDTHKGKEKKSLGDAGIFGECDQISEVEAFNWPNPDYFDFTEAMKMIDDATEKGLAIFSGMWSIVFYYVSEFFGMENYFVKMYTNPAVVEAVTERVLDFYLESNKRFFDIAADKIDVFFMGNDMGSQIDLLISIDLFKKFMLPGMKRLFDLAKSYNLKVAFHSDGAIKKIIPLLIDAGVDVLHPIQVKASGMDAEILAREFGNDIIFMGGVDTQELLPFGTPDQVKNEVRRLKRLFGNFYIASPSHEGILPNVSPKNMLALRDAAFEQI